jgi:hypothetical protein
MALTLFAAVSVFADDEAPAGGDQVNKGRFTQLLELVGSPTFPSLSGLIQPEKMGMLTDNQDNLSDNRVEVDLFSDNQVQILSDFQFLSGISVNVTINLSDGKLPARTKKKACGQAKSKESPKRKKHRRSKQP